jgi:hypothetical protein
MFADNLQFCGMVQQTQYSNKRINKQRLETAGYFLSYSVTRRKPYGSLQTVRPVKLHIGYNSAPLGATRTRDQP